MHGGEPGTESTGTAGAPIAGGAGGWVGAPAGASAPFGVSGASAMRRCPGCGESVAASALVCPWCATALASPRSKRRAVLFAVLFSFWTWVYTYRRDRFRFWMGLSLNLFGALVPAHALGESVFLFVWIWALVDTVTKPKAWYRGYPDR